MVRFKTPSRRRNSVVSISITALMTLIIMSAAACPGRRAETADVPPTALTPIQPAAVEIEPAKTAAAVVQPVKRTTTGKATVLLMGDIRGILRPCGCTVDLQKGGFDRLLPHLEATRAQYPDAPLLHAGPLFFEEAPLEHAKVAQWARQSEVVAELVARVGIDVAGASPVDLIDGGPKVPALVTASKVALTAANASFPKADGAAAGIVASPFEIRTVGPLTFAIFALAPQAELEKAPGTTAQDPTEVARTLVPKLRAQADIVILLSGLGLRNTKRLARKVQGIDFIVAGGLGDAPMMSEEAEPVGDTHVMQFHREGRFVGRLTVDLKSGDRNFIDASAPGPADIEALGRRIAALETALAGWKGTRSPEDRQVRSAEHRLAGLKAAKAAAQAPATVPDGRSSFSFQVTPIEWDLPQDKEILALMDAFDAELMDINLKSVGTLPEATPGQATYVGVETCMECHEETEDFWKGARHAHAWETLETQKKTFDIECVSCHVTGYGEAGGSILGKTKGLEDVQCESCHGPGSLHAESTEPTDIQRVPTEETCVVCHNDHHSPTFDFRRYRAKLLVPGHGKPTP